MHMRKLQLVSFLVILFSFALTYYYYPILPERIATHWNAQGVADGWSGKAMAYLLPSLALLVAGLLVFLPRFDPLRKDAKGFQPYYDGTVLATCLFLVYLNAVTLWINMGNELNISFALVPAFALLFFWMGVMLDHAKPNWFIGIRTPWTLSSEKVWDRTHAFGAKIFKAGGIAIMLGWVFPQIAIFMVLLVAIAAGLGTVVYSYLEYRKIRKAR